ncbi:hypothetical protein ACGFNU_31400 [Spirillospora sp. NPDC048911]|uniref:hypothetical protein n=1 Tax=Spirillospora sp. NPDC048911 TaxID=3364527 RepID=UPI0037228D86
MPAVVILSHQEQLERLGEECPEALDRALVAGDICFDRLAASLPWREDYRAALGLRPGQRLVVVTSTWGPWSLLGEHPGLIARLLADLPVDEYLVAAVIHPNVWHGHSPWQVRAWLADCRRAGLVVVPPREGWRAALVAADLVIGDHGSVTLYGAALGRPVLFGSFPANAVDPRTALAELGRHAAVIDDRPPAEQVDSAITKHDPHMGARVADGAFAAQGRAAEILRAHMYPLMRLDPPPAPARTSPVPPCGPEPRQWTDAERPALLATVAITRSPGRADFLVERCPAEVADLRSAPLRANRHLVVDGTETDHRLRALADLLVQRADARSRPAFGDRALTVAEVRKDGECRLQLPSGGTLALRANAANTANRAKAANAASAADTAVTATATDTATAAIDPSVLASAIYAWVAEGHSIAGLPAELNARTGALTISFTCERISG